MPTATIPPTSDVVPVQDDHGSPSPWAGTRPEAMAPATVPRKKGVTTDEAAKTTPKNRAWPKVAAYLRNANAEPRSTMPTRARTSGTASVVATAAKVEGKPVHHTTSTKISQTWLASQTGPMLWSTWRRSSAPRRVPPAVRS